MVEDGEGCIPFSKLQLINCRLAHDDERRWDITVSHGIIESINPSTFSDGNSDPSSTENSRSGVVDCKGHYLSPGYIDIQLNGAFGVDFSDPNINLCDIQYVAKMLPKFGVTSFCPTMVTSSLSTYTKNISLIGPLCVQAKEHYNHRRRQSSSYDGTSSTNESGDMHFEINGANLVGIHLEGPVFAEEKKGAHSAEYIKTDMSASSSMASFLGETYGTSQMSQSGVSIVTLAPELPGALDLISCLREQNIIVAMGHTSVTLQQAKKAVEHGTTLITHLYNAMNPFHHREPGMMGLVVESNNHSTKPPSSYECPYYSIIVDGLHSHPSAVKIAQTLRPKRVVLITDAIAAMGLGDGDHSLGSVAVTVIGNRATTKGTNTLAGSVVSMDTCVKKFHKFCDSSVGEALDAATIHPANVLGLEKGKGRLDKGYDADMVLLDDDLNVLKTWVSGKILYEKAHKDERDLVLGKKRKLE